MLVVAGVINRDIGVCESDSTFVRDKYSETMARGAGTIIKMFPLPAWKAMTGFGIGRGGGGVAGHAPLSPPPAPASSSTFSGGVNSNKHPAAYGPCFIYSQHGYCRVKRCTYRHDFAAAVARSMGDNRHDLLAAQVAPATAQTAPEPARHRGWAMQGCKAPHERLLHGVVAVAAGEAVVAQGGAAEAVLEAVLQHIFFRIGVRPSPYGDRPWRPLWQQNWWGGDSGFGLWLRACLAATAGADGVGFFARVGSSSGLGTHDARVRLGE